MERLTDVSARRGDMDERGDLPRYVAKYTKDRHVTFVYEDGVVIDNFLAEGGYYLDSTRFTVDDLGEFHRFMLRNGSGEVA